MNPQIPAIQTYYNGFKFRSRIEARWALFFDCMGVPYEYEQEKYDIGSGRYIPDFFLPGMMLNRITGHCDGAFFEVKGPAPTKEEMDKIERLSSITGKAVFLFYGQDFNSGFQADGGEVQVEQCVFCGEVTFEDVPTAEGIAEGTSLLLDSAEHCCLAEAEFAKSYDILEWFMDCQNPPSGGWLPICTDHRSPMLDLAREAARSVRFEDQDHLKEITGLKLACRRLREGRVFCSPARAGLIHRFAATLSADPRCPRYEGTEPWYVAHLANLRAGGGRAACSCFSCESDRKRGAPSEA